MQPKLTWRDGTSNGNGLQTVVHKPYLGYLDATSVLEPRGASRTLTCATRFLFGRRKANLTGQRDHHEHAGHVAVALWQLGAWKSPRITATRVPDDLTTVATRENPSGRGHRGLGSSLGSHHMALVESWQLI